MSDLEFEVIGPVETTLTKPNRGGAQTKRAISLTITAAGTSTEHTFPSIYGACKFAEMFNSRSNIARKVKQKGSYRIDKNGRTLVFT